MFPFILESALELTLRLLEVKDVSILLEHVDLIKTGDGLHIQLLEGSLELLVLSCCAL